MRRTGWSQSIILSALFIVGAGLPGFTPLAESQPQRPLLFAITELKAGQNGHFVTKADINNRSVHVLVDTGASTVALSYEDADRVGLKPGSLKYDVEVSTANGIVKAARVTLREVELGSVRVDNVSGMVLPRGALQGTLLGMSFLSRLRSFSVENGQLILKN
jgi:aspartyl protease family protein